VRADIIRLVVNWANFRGKEKKRRRGERDKPRFGAAWGKLKLVIFHGKSISGAARTGGGNGWIGKQRYMRLFLRARRPKGEQEKHFRTNQRYLGGIVSERGATFMAASLATGS